MHKQRFKQRTFTETLELLCHARGAEFLRGGKINQSEIARRAGTSQPNVSRWLVGDFQPLDENVRKLAKAFGISPAQMRGETPIERLDGVSPKTDLDREFYENLERLPDWYKDSIREQVANYLANTEDEDPSGD